MPKPSDYTPTRRRIMQIVVWSIFAGSVALAAAVTESARRANRVNLAPQTYEIGSASIRLPVKWHTRPHGDDLRVLLQASDAVAGEDGRTVTITCDPLAAPQSPVQYLGSAFGVELPGQTSDRTAYSLLSTAKVGGREGVLVTALSALPGQLDTAKDLYACAIFPSMRAVVVHLQGRGEPNPSDRAVVKQIAAAVALAGEPATSAPGETVTLPEGITFTPPARFAAVAQTDPNRTDRNFWPARDSSDSVQKREAEWATLETVGCLVPPAPADEGRSERMAATFTTLLLARDPLWRGATITGTGRNQWRAEPNNSAGADASFPARAYLMVDSSGQALLAIFRGGFGSARSGGGFDDDAAALASSLKFTGSMDLAHLQDIGAAEAGRFRAEGYEKIIAERDEQWWLWTGPSDRPHVGWSHLDLAAGELAGKSQMHLRRGAGVSHLTEEFNYRDSDHRYHAESVLTDGVGADAKSLRQTTNAIGPQLLVSVSAPGAPSAQWKSPISPQFVPGALFPLILGRLRNTPMLLHSESFIGNEAIGPTEPLTIVIRPTHERPRTASGEDQPMRCLTAIVNGSGQISRWFFRQSGELELIELAGGLVLTPGDRKGVEANFPKGGPLAP